MNQNFYMLIGIPGSGKSSIALDLYYNHYNNKENVIIISSDNIREMLFNDVNNQSDNKKVFDEMQQEVVKYLNLGYNIIYDACNVSIKDRKNILQKINLLNLNLNVIAKVICTPVEIAKQRNENRKRTVPGHVIDKMILKFQLPLYNEGFTEIDFVKNYNNDKIDSVMMFSKMRNFNQNNPHHYHTLDVRCYNTCIDLLDKTKNKELLTAALFHDIGKLYTKSTDDKGVSHYYKHENYGAYISLFFQYPGNIDTIKTAYYINYHMLPFVMENMGENKFNYYKNLLGNLYDDILLLHESDIK